MEEVYVKNDRALDNADVIEDGIYKEVYDDVVLKIWHLVEHGELNVANVQEIFKDVMEAVEAVGKTHSLSGVQKGQMAGAIALRIVDDLHDRGKVNDDFHKKFKQGMEVFGIAIFALPILASQGKIIVNQITEAIEESACCQKCGAKCTIL